MRRRTRRSGRSSPPSSRTPASRSSSSSIQAGASRGKIAAALEAGQPPDFAFGLCFTNYIGQWAFDDRLVDLSDAVGHFSDLFDPDVLSLELWLNGSTGQKALYGLPMGRTTTHVHVWKSLLEQAGFTLADIPKEWDAFWSFWCDQVQPAVRRATGPRRHLGCRAAHGGRVWTLRTAFFQFLAAYEADYVTRDGRLVIDDPEIRRSLIEAIDSYTAFYRKGCTPPDAVDWSTGDRNNKAFLGQTVVMTVNQSLSIPNALKSERPDDYYENTATIEWPLGPSGEPFPILGGVFPAVVFKDGDHVETAEEFVRFLVGEGWLMHYLNFSGERMLPPMPKLLDQPFWLDPSDPHRMAAVMQVARAPELRLRSGLGRLAARPGLAGVDLGEGDPSHRRRGHQPRAGGRRGDRPDQADPERSQSLCGGSSMVLPVRP